MRRIRGIASVCCVLAGVVGALAGASVAGARPAQPEGTGSAATVPAVSHTSLPQPSLPSTLLVPTQLQSAPAGAHAGGSYLLNGVIEDQGTKAGGSTLTVRLMHIGSKPITIGAVGVSAAGISTSSFHVPIKLPSHLANGSYSILGCVPMSGGAGALQCATAERHIQVGRSPIPALKPVKALPVTRGPRAIVADACTPGAHTLSHLGDHVYPEMGNGGYSSVHTDVYLNYDAPSDMFLPGTHVVLTYQATHCLSNFSLDFEAHGPNNGNDPGPNMSISQILVNGQPATWTFVQPTYPGDPNGQNDPDPNAHLAGQTNPISATFPYAPACAPEGSSTSLYGTQCPANKLVITPSTPIPNGSAFAVEVDYAGQPGVHTDGDGTDEGWFKTPGDGSFVTTEPVGTEDWMPLNNHPSAKPTYDFYDTTNTGKTAIANGELVSQTNNPADSNFPSGSTTWHWHSPETIANYLVENSIASFSLSQRLTTTGPNAGVVYYEAQSTSLTPTKLASNKVIMDQQPAITDFESLFNGPYPATTDGVIVDATSASFEEEMQTKITFNGGNISLSTFHHENFHQWWGDHVSEGNFNFTFIKEGMAQLAQYLLTAAGTVGANGTSTNAPGSAAFNTSLIGRFNTNWSANGSSWVTAPSNPTPQSLFTTSNTYTRPATAYIALYQINGLTNFDKVLQNTQKDYGFGSITESQWEAEWARELPNQSAACQAKLGQFFTQWFDTAYPTGGGANKPQITGPGLMGTNFYDPTGSCSTATPPVTTASFSPAANGGVYANPTITLTATPEAGATIGQTFYSLDGGAWTPYTVPFQVTATGQHTLQFYSTDTQGNQELTNAQTFFVDQTPPANTTPSGNVASSLQLSIGGGPLALGTFTPGVAATYTTSVNASVTTTAAQSTLSIYDASSTATGHLVNGIYALPSALQAGATDSFNSTPHFGAVGSTAAPWTLLNIPAPAANDPVTVDFSQTIGATDPLRTGPYSKTLTLTLSTVTP